MSNEQCQFEASTQTSSATICKWCGQEKFQHNKILIMSNKQTTALQQLKTHLQKDVKLRFILQKDVDRINWYIDTYFLPIERKQIEEAWTHGAENWDAEMEGDDYFTSTFTEE